MPARSAVYISALPHPGPLPMYPLPLLQTKPKTLKLVQLAARPVPKLPEGYAFAPLCTAHLPRFVSSDPRKTHERSAEA
jgi:hypothetical protein